MKLEETVELAQNVKRQLLQVPEVRFVLFQAGRPNDGTDPLAFSTWSFMYSYILKKTGVKALLEKSS